MAVKDTVLIVDDDTRARHAAETLLRSRGLQARAAHDATEACDIICCEGVAVVVLDPVSPGMRGFELLRRIHGRFETRTLPMQPRVVIVTESVEAEVERSVRQMGADVILRKPLLPAQFIAAIEQQLRRRATASALAYHA